jgi:hypothetical protein
MFADLNAVKGAGVRWPERSEQDGYSLKWTQWTRCKFAAVKEPLKERPIEWATILLCIREVPSSNPFTIYIDGGLSLFCQSIISYDSELYSDCATSLTTVKSRFNSRWDQAICISSRNVQTGFDVYPVSNLIAAGGCFPAYSWIFLCIWSQG